MSVMRPVEAVVDLFQSSHWNFTIPIRPKARPRTESPSGPNMSKTLSHLLRRLRHSLPMQRGAVRPRTSSTPMSPDRPTSDSLQWARLKAAKDPRVSHGMENQTIPKFENLNDFVILGSEHYLAGWAEYYVRGEQTH